MTDMEKIGPRGRMVLALLSTVLGVAGMAAIWLFTSWQVAVGAALLSWATGIAADLRVHNELRRRQREQPWWVTF